MTTIRASAYAAIPYVPGLKTVHFTISVYAYRSDWSIPGGAYEALLEKNWGYGLWQVSGNLEARLFTNEVSSEWPSISVLDLTPGWHRFAMSYDGMHDVLSIDGSQVATTRATGRGCAC